MIPRRRKTVTVGGAGNFDRPTGYIGPEVNSAFRMEKVAKDLGLGRLVSAPTAERLPPPIATRPAGRCGVAGFCGHWDFHTFD